MFVEIKINMGKIRTCAEQKIIDHQTGEIIKTTTCKEWRERVKTTDRFYMTFIDFISPIYKIKSDSAKNLLRWMCCNAEYNTGKVALTTSARDEISRTLGIKNNTITNNLALLKKAKLISGERGEFYINMAIFWKGDSETRTKLIKDKDFVVRFGFDDPKEE